VAYRSNSFGELRFSPPVSAVIRMFAPVSGSWRAFHEHLRLERAIYAALALPRVPGRRRAEAKRFRRRRRGFPVALLIGAWIVHFFEALGMVVVCMWLPRPLTRWQVRTPDLVDSSYSQ
jgi:hypothetical protein